MEADGVVVIGMSAGGLSALREIAIRLPLDLGAAVIIAHHAGPASVLPALLTAWSGRSVAFANAGEPLQSNRLYVCPPEHHVSIEPDGRLALSTCDRIDGVRPSIDWLFSSAATSYGDCSIGLVLSGANCDGARGLHEIECAGGQVLVQDVASSEYSTMPEAALLACPSAMTARPSDLAAAIVYAVRCLGEGSSHMRSIAAW